MTNVVQIKPLYALHARHEPHMTAADGPRDTYKFPFSNTAGWQPVESPGRLVDVDSSGKSEWKFPSQFFKVSNAEYVHWLALSRFQPITENH
jgi:hypothetical protein